MRFHRLLFPTATVGLLCLAASLHGADLSPLVWRDWSPDVFAEARRDHKLVLLDLEAVWCHWCHLMAETTYREPSVAGFLRERFIVVRVDQDSRPDLATRYQDYGWPATVLFASDGTEVRKRRGYIAPEEMLPFLRDAVEHPVDSSGAEASVKIASSTVLRASRREELLDRWRRFYDHDKGGWGFRNKYLDWDNLELALRLAATGDGAAKAMATQTLRLQREHLLDPVWGGVYQYSVGGDWREPHFEKLIQFQAENLRTFARAYLQFGDSADLETAKSIHRYVRDFLTGPAHTVYVSQDADLVPGEHSADYFRLDDAGRRERGIPRVDRHVYARENGWYITARCEFYAATQTPALREEAIDAAQWIIAHRSISGGGFSHDDKDPAGPYLGDTLAMGRAFLALHEVTQDRSWLDRAEAAAGFIAAHFALLGGGFASSDTSRSALPAPRADADENIALVRFATALSAATGRSEGQRMATGALRWLLAEATLDARGSYVAGLLVAEEEARTEPLHITIVARKGDTIGRDLFAAALRAPTAHKLVEYWDPSEPAPRGENLYPDIGRPAAFVCVNHACSAPMFSVAALAKRIGSSVLPAETRFGVELASP